MADTEVIGLTLLFQMCTGTVTCRLIAWGLAYTPLTYRSFRFNLAAIHYCWLIYQESRFLSRKGCIQEGDMERELSMRGVIQLAVLLLVPVIFISPLHAKEGETARIERLLRVAAVSKVSFVIEGTMYNADEMARHLRDKLEKSDKKSLTVENFISHLANSSSRNGRPYMVVLENGHTTYAGPWFRGLLHDIEKGRFQETTEGTAPTSPISP